MISGDFQFPSALKAAFFLVLVGTCSVQQASAQQAWNKEKAIAFLDSRAQTWLDWSGNKQTAGGHGGSVSCFACHTAHTYAFVRPTLGNGRGSTDRIYDNIRRRLASGTGVPPWYSDPAGKDAQSRGTEAINSTYVLALRDAMEGRTEPSETLRTALERLWLFQNGDGGWTWFDFGLEPFGAKESSFFAACQAAVAVGTAPGYYVNGKTAEAWVEPHISLLKKFILANRDRNNLFGEAWLLMASQKLDGLLTSEQQRDVMNRLRVKQHKGGDEDGGYALWELNTWTYSEPAPPAEPRTLHPLARKPEGFSTALLTYALLDAGTPASDPAVMSAVRWLIRNQQSDGSWRTYSITRNRPESDVAYLFLSDEASIWSVRLLTRKDVQDALRR